MIVGGLRPNYNYTCVIGERLQEGAQVFNGQVSEPITFCTDYAGIVKLSMVYKIVHKNNIIIQVGHIASHYEFY